MKTLAIAAVAALAVPDAQAASVSFGGLGSGVSFTLPVGGASVTVTGGAVDDTLSTFIQTSLFSDADGLGVIAQSGTGGNDPFGNPVTAGDGTLDGVGVNANEYVRLSFSREVTLTGLGFGLFDDFDDVYVGVSGQPGIRYSNMMMGPGDFDLALSLTGTDFDVVAGFPDPTTSGGGHTDSFTLRSAEIAPVPVPAAAPLLAGGLGLLGWIGARRRRG